MGSFGLVDVVGNTFGYSRVIVYGADGKIKFPTGGGGGGTVTSIGMTVPSAFSVTPSTITTSGTFAITAIGTVSQYIDGTGALQTFPTIPTGNGIIYGVATGTNTYTTTIAGVTAYTAGDVYAINFTNGNDDDSTIDINGLGPQLLTKEFDVQVTGGDIVSGQELILIYDGTRFQCIGVAPNQLFAFVTNDDSVTITKGQPVYAFGSAGNRMSVKLANNTSDATSAQTVGLVFSPSIAAGQRGFIITQGVISGINTAAYSPGDTLYLGATAGTLTSTKPFAPNHLVYIGTVERANAGQGQIYVRPQNGFEMNELHDVQSNSAINKDILYRDTTVTPNLWKPASIPTILGYTPVPDTRTLTINGVGYNLTADRSWTVTAGSADIPEISVSTANAREDDYAPTGWPNASNVVKVIRINSTNTDYMMSLGGLSNPTAGRIVTIYNASTANNLIIIENLSTSSTAANRFRMANNIAYFLLPNRSITFLYDGTYWTQFSASNAGGFDFFDDCTGGGSAFVGTSSVGLCGVHSAGTASGVRGANAGSFDGFGEYSMSTGSTTTGYSSVSVLPRRAGGNNAFGAYVGTSTIPYITVGKVFLASLATIAQDYQVHFGMNGTASLPANNPGVGYLWYYPGTASSFWNVRSQNTGGTTTQVATSLTAATGYVWLGVYKPGGSTSRDAMYFYSTNGIIYQMAYKFVGVAGAYGGIPTATIGAITGTTAKELNIDWIGAAFNLAR